MAQTDYSVWGIKNKGDQQISVLADKLLLGEAHKFKDKWDKDNSGKLYQVELAPAEDEYLLWDKPLSEQSDRVKAALNIYPETWTGDKVYNYIAADRDH